MSEQFRLSNGVQVVLEENLNIRSVAFGIWIKNGSRNENIEVNGISHFIEHMLFKGTTTRTARELADEIDAIGGQINAYTSKEYTCYYTRTLSYHFDTALEVLSDMFFNSTFNCDDIDKECSVILEEINMYEDTPEELVHDLLQYQIWKNDSLGYPILGTKDTIANLDRDTFLKYYLNHYHQENTLIAIAGCFDTHEMLEKLEKTFGQFKRENHWKSPDFSTPYTPNIIVRQKEIEQAHLAVAFPSIPIGSVDSYSLSILNTIFGGGMSSRLFQKIREENALAYSVYSYNSSYTNTGLFTIYAGLNPAQLEQALTMIVKEIQNLFIEQLEPLQLTRTKEQIKSNFLMSLESSSNIMSNLGKSQMMLGKILTHDQIIEKINAVTLESLDAVAKRIFDFKQMSISVVGNINEPKFRQFASSFV